MPVLESITRLVAICARKAVTQFVISPGSRSAPLTLALARHPATQCRVVPDERSAGFLALGMALQSRQPVGLVCTSGTAVLNYGPAVAEAYYQQVPLLVLTADRPPEWLEQQDGQTIRQRGAFGPHVKAAYELLADHAHPDALWFVERTVNEAVNLSRAYPPGPVHINVPIREPFYPLPGEQIVFPDSVRIIRPWAGQPVLSAEQWADIREIWEGSRRRLVVAGQAPRDPALLQVLRGLQQEQGLPVVGDALSNLHALPDTICHADTLLMQPDDTLRHALRPDLLITFGNSVISKNLKLFLRTHRPAVHWHLQPAGRTADAFQTLTDILAVPPLYFFQTLFNDLDYQAFLQHDDEPEDEYAAAWQHAERQARLRLPRTLAGAAFSEFEAVREILHALPPDSLLHVANSMPIRYVNFAGLYASPGVELCANRGTSGIDGCTGTAVGAAWATTRPVTLITGDMAFLYDRNSLWHNHLPPNLRIVVLNNHGGGIFRLLDGPAAQPERADYFETRQHQTAEATARDFGLAYTACATRAGLAAALPAFFRGAGAALLEIETDPEANETAWRRFKAG